ncbi:MAG: ATP-binding protein [Halopseudomonas yangmingensis]|uniref:histidine kinase n=1 Tax=Halopseudomonas yangmingensis TaxID=1720063 RepID=A0A1I4RYQ2_9GAMM|nr:ATP-binding protein [Halopseudomonas yangmingensis]SFM57369.1 two-component system, OmpR family, osmolarity sensor histidine kinase EnvZ [Halopseudomonas yangmingensis]
MKGGPGWHPLLPRSFFARTLLLVLLVTLFSKVLTMLYLLSNEDLLVDRQYSHGTAMLVRAYWASDLPARADIEQLTGLQLIHQDVLPRGEVHWPYTGIFINQLRDELGDRTRVRVRIQDKPALWIHQPGYGEYWLKVPMYTHPLRGQRIWMVITWLLLIGMLSTAAAWIFVRQLNHPLKVLESAARRIGQGHSVRLLDTGCPAEIAEVYRAFNQMSADVEQASRDRSLLLAGVSHDLRTPLTRMRLSTELLSSAEPELTEGMIRDIEDMDEILDQFMAYIRDGNDEPSELADINEVLREVAAPHNGTGECVRLCLEPVPLFSFRRLSVKRLLANLVENAVRHAGCGVEVISAVTRNAAQPYLVISVLDRGPGIDPTDVDSLFVPFIRGDRARSTKGTGLGLAIVKRIADSHGATVQLLNREGGGMEARVNFPLPQDSFS